MKYWFFFARLLMVILFFFSMYGKIMHFDAQAAMTASKWVPFASLAIVLAIIFESIWGTLLLIWKKWASFWAFLLFVFMIIITPIFFPFWNNPNVINNFMSNVAIMWGLWFMVMHYWEADLACVKKFLGNKKS